MGFWPVVMKAIRNADVVIFVLDARMPHISRNKELEKRLKESRKEILIVFNKIDLISPSKLKELQRDNARCFFVSSKNRKGMNDLRLKLQILAKSMDLGEEGRLDVGMVGYPNVGKSALTNILIRARKANVSAKAGTTRGIQWVGGTRIRILDSPGVIPFRDEEVKLGILGAKDPEKLKNPEKVALKIITLFLENRTKNIESLYKIKIDKEDSYGVFMKIGETRNLLKKGGVVDDQRTAETIIRDWQRGKLVLG